MASDDEGFALSVTSKLPGSLPRILRYTRKIPGARASLWRPIPQARAPTAPTTVCSSMRAAPCVPAISSVTASTSSPSSTLTTARRRTSRSSRRCIRRLAVGRVRVVAAARACSGADGGGGPASGGRRRDRRRVKRSDRLGPGGGRWAARGDGLWHGPSRRAGAAWMDAVL